MTNAIDEELLGTLKELRTGQIKQITLAEQAIEVARADVTSREISTAKLREEWTNLANQQNEKSIKLREEWTTLVNQQNEKSMRRYRVQVRVYGLMMVVFGAVFAMLLLNALHSR